MQQTGTLRKRRRRNLAKVNGLTNVPYDETSDAFSLQPGNTFIEKPINVIKAKDDIRLQFSARVVADLYGGGSNGYPSRNRVTRIASLHEAILNPEISEVAVNVENIEPFEVRQKLADFENRKLPDRTHFLDKYTLQRLRQLIWLGVTSGSFPWRWNDKDFKIDDWSPTFCKLWWYQRLVVSFQCLLIGCYQLHGFLQSFTPESTKTNREIFMSSFSLLRYNYVLYINYNLYKYKDKTREYINTLLLFNKNMVQKYLIHLDGWHDGGRALINFAILVNLVQVFISVSLFLIMPYQPWYMFSYIYPKPFYWLVPGAIQEYMLVGQIITSYMLIAWCIVAHSNTINFWLREIHHHNDSDYTIDDIRTSDSAFGIYKSLQVLNICFNECLSPLALPILKVLMATALVPCGYVLIRSMNQKFIDEFPGILVYPMAVTDCSIAGFVTMSMASEIFDLGCGFIDSWSQTKHKDLRRVLMSCPTLKVWVARFYFVTVSTTVTFFKVVFDYITNCIIAFP